MVPTKCTWSDSDNLCHLLPSRAHHDRPEWFGPLHEQRHGTYPPRSHRRLGIAPDNSQFMFTALLHRRASFISLANVWVTSFLGNLAGTLFFMAIVTGCRSPPTDWMLKGRLTRTCRWWNLRDSRLPYGGHQLRDCQMSDP